MKHFPTDKYNVAWFKLAECVARGEKEKALGVYRLLVHSLDDAAFSRQLEGDLLLAFKDSAAIDKYVVAADLYKSNRKIAEAAAVYEHLVTLMPDSEQYLNKLIELYEAQNMPAHELHQRVVLTLLDVKGVKATVIISHLEKALDRLLEENNPHVLQTFLSKIGALEPRYYERALQYLSGRK